MTRISKRRMVAGLVVTLGVADGVGIYVAQHRLDRPTDVGPREMAVANQALAEPIAIQANGGLKATPALAESVVAPHASPAQAAPQRTVRFALADPVKAPEAVKVSATRAPVIAHTSRQTGPVVTGRMALAEQAVSHRTKVRRSLEVASRAERNEDLRVHQQRIPARLTHAERRPARDDAFAAAFGDAQDELRLPEPAYGRPDPQPRDQASAELPPLELSTAQIHSDPSGASGADALPAPPPTTAAGGDDALPKS